VATGGVDFELDADDDDDDDDDNKADNDLSAGDK
jgi:hypothetical protein